MELAEKLIKEIYESYPKVLERIYDKYQNKLLDTMSNFHFFFKKDGLFLEENNYELRCRIPFSMLYGLFIDFFAEYGKNLVQKTIDLYDSVGFDKENINRAQYNAILNLCELL